VLHHMKGEATPRRAIELWQTGEAGELLSHFPEMAPAILPVHEKLDLLARKAAGIAFGFSHLDRKEFALRVKGEAFSSVAFKLFGGPATEADALAFMRTQSIAALERMVEGAP